MGELPNCLIAVGYFPIAAVPLGIRLGAHSCAIIDMEDAPKILRHRWYLSDKGYAVRGRLKSEGPGVGIIRMHHEIVGRPPSGLVTDHRNGNRLDNRKSNLRIVTYSQNGANTRRALPVSGTIGVRRYGTGSLWEAHITKNGVTRHARFKTKEEAIAHRATWEAVEQGEFRPLPPPPTTISEERP